MMREGSCISFKTKGGTVVLLGRVLSFDEYLTLPLRVEYHTAAGDKRIERFHPNEFEFGHAS